MKKLESILMMSIVCAFCFTSCGNDYYIKCYEKAIKAEDYEKAEKILMKVDEKKLTPGQVIRIYEIAMNEYEIAMDEMNEDWEDLNKTWKGSDEDMDDLDEALGDWDEEWDDYSDDYDDYPDDYDN